MDKDRQTKPGEKVFPVFLLLLGGYVTWESRKMYRHAPELQGYGTVPLICGILMMFLSLVIIINNFRISSEISGQPVKQQVQAVVRHLFCKDVLVMLVVILAYCLVMYFGVPFVVASPVFLWISMCYLRGGFYIRNLIYTAIIMVFVLLVFNVAFHVVLP